MHMPRNPKKGDWRIRQKLGRPRLATPAMVQFYPDNEIQQALARANADQARKIQALPPLLPQQTQKSRLQMATSGSQKLNSR